MYSIVFVSLLACIVTCYGTHLVLSKAPARQFTIDYKANTFLKDGEPFRYISGSFHYFRALPETWQKKLRTMRAAGLNAVSTYVEWSLHNPKDGVYNWEGIANLEKFIQLAVEEDLYVILRPGPYICAERDNGGFPYWILRKYPGIQMRTYDLNYMREVKIWYNELMARITPYLYGMGGPIIMVQVENEYGSYFTCNQRYREWLRNLTFSYVKENAVLFTNDGPSQVGCGHIPGVLATLDFGSAENTTSAWSRLRRYQPNGPLVNSEFYPGWLTHWQEDMQRTPTEYILPTFREMLDDGASVNFYMFFGGTNFGFTAGANDNGPGKYTTDVTSYDYDAPMDESGDPTSKYTALREIIAQYLPLANISVPLPTHKESYGTVKLLGVGSILSHDGRKYLSDGVVSAVKPKTFEYLDQFSGLVLYETKLPDLKKDPSVLKIHDIRDRAYVYVDREYIGILSREQQAHSLPIRAQAGTTLQILVENQGRINFNVLNDFKGILSDVLLEQQILKDWNMTKYSFNQANKMDQFIERVTAGRTRHHRSRELLRTGPTVFHGELVISGNQTYDTYLDPTGWGKGFVFINGFNLGRYWPVVGPQITLYVPKEILTVGSNRIILIEYQKAPESNEIKFVDIPNLDGV